MAKAAEIGVGGGLGAEGGGGVMGDKRDKWALDGREPIAIMVGLTWGGYFYKGL